MSVLTLYVDEVMRTLSNDGQYPFVVNDKTVDIVRFALNTGFTDVVLDENSALRVMYQRPGESQVRAQTLTYHDTDGLRNYYDWHLLSADLTEKGTLTVALCILRTDGDVEEWHTTPCQIRVLNTIHTDDSDEVDESITPTVAQRVAVLETMIQRVASGAPIVVASTSAMTDTDQIYVLSTDGMWYYHNGTSWVSGGNYGAVATDRTLTHDGIPADGKATGDRIGAVEEYTAITEGQKNVITGLLDNDVPPSGVPTDTTLTQVYKAAGSILFANLPALSSTYLGYVYNIKDSFATTSDFVEGAGISYPSGTNVVIVVLTDGVTTTYKYDVLSGAVDLSAYYTKTQIDTMVGDIETLLAAL